MKYKSPPKHQTPLYRVRASYSGMRRRCVGGVAHAQHPAYKGVHLRFGREEWIDWALPRYAKFMEAYPELVPCVSRFGDRGDYAFDNIEVTSTVRNRAMMRTLLHVREDGTKMCSRCREVQPVDEFCKNRSRPTGLDHWCRTCHRVVRGGPRAPRPPRDPSIFKHGTGNGYVNKKCRCDLCRAYQRDRMRAYNDKRKQSRARSF